jgi:hypothetical protein
MIQAMRNLSIGAIAPQGRPCTDFGEIEVVLDTIHNASAGKRMQVHLDAAVDMARPGRLWSYP